ncbi:MAG: hypothetical protein Q8L29_01755 [archaeon]|nr:hypothetical protein [archaeon]
MQIIGFSFSKISGYKSKKAKLNQTNINIDFLDIQEEESQVLKIPTVRVSFMFTVSYEGEDKNLKAGEILYEGDIVISATESEIKDISKAWKKKELPTGFRVPIFNFILQRCSIKALNMEEDLQLPTHIPLPTLRPQKSEEKVN